jgi:hypothetical protein
MTTPDCTVVGNTLTGANNISIFQTKIAFDEFIGGIESLLNTLPTNSEQIPILNKNITDATYCYNKKISERVQIPTTIATMQNDIMQMTSAMEADREALEISKARATYIDEARRPVSYYESWFPLGRPLAPLTLLLLVGVTAFMAILGTLLLFSTLGINVIAERTALTNPILIWLSRLGYPFWIALVLLIVFFTLYLNK